MRRIAFGLFLLFISIAAAVAEVPPTVSLTEPAAQPAFPVVDLSDAGAVLSALLAGRQESSCAAQGTPAGVPVLLAQPMQNPAAKGAGDLVQICCDCLDTRCCPRQGTCMLCGDLVCICCNRM